MATTDRDDAYDNFGHIPAAADYPPRWAAAAAAFRAARQAEIDLAYGDHPRQRLDLFRPEAAPEGLAVFVHGGYWRANDKSMWSHLAAGALARGYAVAIPSYVLAPEARISAITRQVAAAVGKAAAMVDGPIRLAGHSAGGHLVTRMLGSDRTQPRLDGRIRRVVSISGLHDLRPLLNTAMNRDLRLDEGEAAAESPILDAGHLAVPVIAWVGGDERPAFIDQANWLARAWPEAGAVIDPGRHHFDVIDALADAQSPLVAALFA
ncbi:MAG: alpha/beta hydrolase [Rhodobacteraceae bacterium]|nr:alpha/beta hydrolase [Paracoccaceae bacterium]